MKVGSDGGDSSVMTMTRTLARDTAAVYYGPRFSLRSHHYSMFARGKVGHDPIYIAILERGLIHDHARVLDLGCGQLLIAALLQSASARFTHGEWPATWPAPPRHVTCHGIELRADVVRFSKHALTGMGTVEWGDLNTATLHVNDVTIMLDVIHYLDPAAQERLLQRIADALVPGGILITRVADTLAGFSYLVTRVGDQMITLVRGLLGGSPTWPKFHTRPLVQWRALIERFGFELETVPMSQGTPFANVMIIARKPQQGGLR